MDDRPTIALGIAVVSILVSTFAIRQFEKRAVAQLEQQLGGGQVQVRIKTDGIFGGAAGQVRSLRVEASKFAIDGLPIGIEPQYPKDGRIGMLELHLTDFVLTGLPVEELRVRIPDMRFDKNLAVNRQRLRLTQSGEGEAYASITEDGLRTYLLKKFAALSEVKVTLASNHAIVEGDAVLFFGPTRFRAEGKLSPREGRYLDLMDARVDFNGIRVSDSEAQALVRLLNPVIDENRDLHLNDAVTITEVRLEKGRMIVTGRARAPAMAAEQPGRALPAATP